MSQNRNCKHSSKIWLQCIRVLLSPVFCTCKNLLWTLCKLASYQSNILWYWAWIHITIPNRDDFNWARHRIHTSNKPKQNINKQKNPTHTHTKKKGKGKPTQPPLPILNLIFNPDIKLAHSTETDNTGESHTNLH